MRMDEYQWTANRRLYNRLRKLWLFKRGKIFCSRCRYHKGDNLKRNPPRWVISRQEDAKMNWFHAKNDRDENGELTPLALAIDAIEGNGCDCGEDEPGTCLACLCEAALKYLFEKLERLENGLTENR